MTQPAGWYDDPQDPDALRYWDGVQWTNHTSPRQRPAAPESAAEQQGQQQAWGQPGGQGTTPQQGQVAQGYPGHQEQQQNPYAGQTGQAQGYGQYGQAPQYSGQYGAPVAATPDGAPMGNWGLRLLARLIDGLLTSVVFGVLGFFIGRNFVPDNWMDEVDRIGNRMEDWQRATESGTLTPAQEEELYTLAGDMLSLFAPAFFTIAAFVVIGAILYETLMLKTAGGTVGKLITGLRVRPYEPGKPLSIGQAIGRSLFWYLTGPIPFFSLLNGLWPLWDSKKQSLNDKVARTAVVRRR